MTRKVHVEMKPNIWHGVALLKRAEMSIKRFTVLAEVSAFIKEVWREKISKNPQTPLFFFARSNSLQKSEAPLRSGLGYEGNFLVSVIGSILLRMFVCGL